MTTYAVTGSASGMGKASAERLRVAGHTVIGIDLKDADVVADLSTSEGRAAAVTEVLTRTGGVLDGAVLAAGLGPHPGREKLIAQVNYFGVVELLTGWRDALTKAGDARVVVFSSNSTTTVPLVPEKTIRAFLAGDAEKAIAATRRFRGNASAMVYAGSKIAVTRWLRRAAVLPEWAEAGIRLNAVAPGAILTPMVEAQLADPHQRGAIEAFPIPVGRHGRADEVAEAVMFLLGPASAFMAGTVLFVDGGTDAYFRSDDWPRQVPFTGLRRYIRLGREYAAKKGVKPNF
jgi:NAD(P)-dependent dehydrogenase (short-subunit alcohol dehydrogenase family)